jgi:hypothetical protein
MNCTACGQPNADGVTHCMRCGAPTGYTNNYQQPNPGGYQQPNYQQPQQVYNYMLPQQPVQGNKQDLGFLLLAIFPLVHRIFWWMFDLVDLGGWKIRMTFSLLLMLGEFAIMLFFTKNTTYRIIIGILAFIMFALNVYNIFRY